VRLSVITTIALCVLGAARAEVRQPVKRAVLISPKEAWAITERKDGRELLRFDGKKWQTEPRVHPSLLAASPRGDVWIVEEGRVLARGPREFALLLNLPPAPVPREIDLVYGISASELWVARRGEPPWRWNGRAWESLAAGFSDEMRTMFVARAAFASSAGDLWLGGAWQAESLDGATRIDDHLLHWNGTSWSSHPGGVHAQKPDLWIELRAIGGSAPNDLWAAGVGRGMKRDESVLLRYDGTGWSMITSPSRVPVDGIFARSANDVWLFGGATTIPVLLHHTGTLEPRNLGSPVLALAADKSGTLWSIDDRLKVQRFEAP
jgi:hypothetical protein